MFNVGSWIPLPPSVPSEFSVFYLNFRIFPSLRKLACHFVPFVFFVMNQLQRVRLSTLGLRLGIIRLPLL